MNTDVATVLAVAVGALMLYRQARVRRPRTAAPLAAPPDPSPRGDCGATGQAADRADCPLHKRLKARPQKTTIRRRASLVLPCVCVRGATDARVCVHRTLWTRAPAQADIETRLRPVRVHF